MSRVLEIKSVTEYQAFKNNFRRGVIFYGATWCEACKDVEELYRRIANRYHKRISLAHVDIDMCKLDFTVLPVFVAFYKGNLINSMEGADEKSLKAFVKQAIQFDTEEQRKAHNNIAPGLITDMSNHAEEYILEDSGGENYKSPEIMHEYPVIATYTKPVMIQDTKKRPIITPLIKQKAIPRDTEIPMHVQLPAEAIPEVYAEE